MRCMLLPPPPCPTFRQCNRVPVTVPWCYLGSKPPPPSTGVGCLCLVRTVRQVRRELLHWYDHNHRVLPWRRTPHSKKGEGKGGDQDQGTNGNSNGGKAAAEEGEAEPAPADLPAQQFAYWVWVSEIMLQQTQVGTEAGRQAASCQPHAMLLRYLHTCGPFHRYCNAAPQGCAFWCGQQHVAFTVDCAVVSLVSSSPGSCVLPSRRTTPRRERPHFATLRTGPCVLFTTPRCVLACPSAGGDRGPLLQALGGQVAQCV